MSTTDAPPPTDPEAPPGMRWSESNIRYEPDPDAPPPTTRTRVPEMPSPLVEHDATLPLPISAKIREPFWMSEIRTGDGKMLPVTSLTIRGEMTGHVNVELVLASANGDTYALDGVLISHRDYELLRLSHEELERRHGGRR